MVGLEHNGHRIAIDGYGRALGRRLDLGHFVPQCLQKAQDTVIAFGSAYQRWNYQSFRKLACEIGEYLFTWRIYIREQFLHQVLVIVGELLEHLETGLL